MNEQQKPSMDPRKAVEILHINCEKKAALNGPDRDLARMAYQSLRNHFQEFDAEKERERVEEKKVLGKLKKNSSNQTKMDKEGEKD